MIEKKLFLYFKFKTYFYKCMYMHYKTKIEEAGSYNGNFNKLSLENLPKIDTELAKEYFFIHFSDGKEFQKLTHKEYEEKLYNLFDTFRILPKDDQFHEVDFLEKILELYPPQNPSRIIHLLINRIHSIYANKKSVYYSATDVIERLIENTRIACFDKYSVLDDDFLEAVDILLKVTPKQVKKVQIHHIILTIHILAEMKNKKSIEKLKFIRTTIWYSHLYVEKMLEEHIKMVESDGSDANI